MKKDKQRPRFVGVFWLVGRALLIDKTPLAEAERYGNHLTNPRNHSDVWEQWQKLGRVPCELEYEHEPRGRVNFDVTSERFTLMADRCILQRRQLLARIKSKMNLPKGTSLASDPHYRCYKCLYGTDDEE
jgi:hypothetical protein